MPSFYPANVPLVNYFFYNYTLTADGPNLPLAGGFVFFRDDNDHDVDKPTYSDVTDPDNPVVNPNPLPLNAQGAWPFFYAEQGLYYIIITGPDMDLDNPIWTLEHVNFAGDAGSTSENVTNFIPNGQFLLHNDLPATADYDAGEIREAITDIAYGGWTFERPADSTATDIVTFERYDEYESDPSGNPRYAIRVQCTASDSSDDYKDIRVKFPNVNRFASAVQEYTFALAGLDNDADSFPIQLYLIKNFGTGGSDETQTLLTTFTLTPDEGDFYYAFSFGTNEGEVIGPDDDDYIQLAIRLSANQEFDITLTDFQLQSGNLAEPIYPETTQRQDVSAALGGGFPIPNTDGSDLFLLPRLTKSGWVYDRSEIGDVVSETQTSLYDPTTGLHPTTNRMLAVAKKYIRTEYSPLGVPYSRLFDKYWLEAQQVPRYGTGADYLTGVFSGSGNELVVTNNSAGSVTNAADGTPATGFTFANIHEGDSGYFCKAYMVDTDKFYIENLEPGAVNTGTAGTSGFTVSAVLGGTSTVNQIISVTTIAAATLAGKYFTFITSNGGAQNYYCWYKVDGAGSDPAPGGTGILIDLNSTDTLTQVAEKTQQGLNGWEVTSIKTVAASAIPAGAYFTINATGGAYVIWYKKDGSGTEPVAVGTKIQVDIVAADTNTQIASKTQRAINRYSFASPDFRGQFLRGFSNNSGVDQGVRFSMVPGVPYGADVLGKFELSANQAHAHETYYQSSQAGGGATIDVVVGPGGTVQDTSVFGIYESRPVNANVNLAIIY
jgi:hypothetical protein